MLKNRSACTDSTLGNCRMHTDVSFLFQFFCCFCFFLSCSLFLSITCTRSVLNSVQIRSRRYTRALNVFFLYSSSLLLSVDIYLCYMFTQTYKTDSHSKSDVSQFSHFVSRNDIFVVTITPHSIEMWICVPYTNWL